MSLSTEDDDFNTDLSPPTLSIALEYVKEEQMFNFYIKKVSNTPYILTHKTRQTRAVVSVVKGLQRTTWMGRPRSITWNEIQQNKPEQYRTLAVPRLTLTMFNEFFSAPVPIDLFHSTMLKIQLCDVSRDDHEVAIAECDLWIDENPITSFQKFSIPLQISQPDIGELEMTLTFLPTAQRILIERCKATNLTFSPGATEVYVRALTYTDGKFDEIHRSDIKKAKSNPEGLLFSRRLVYDLLRRDVWNCVLVVQVVELIEKKKRMIGQVAMSYAGPGYVTSQWRKMADVAREPCTEVHRLQPGVL